jgi:hypothetical protein
VPEAARPAPTAVPEATEWGASARAHAPAPTAALPLVAAADPAAAPPLAAAADPAAAPKLAAAAEPTAAPKLGTAAEPTAAPAGSQGAATPTRPPGREPIRLRWWLLALAVLWVIWFVAKPYSQKIDARIDRAISLAVECKASEAQSELIALRATKATPEQLERLQQALNDAAADCRHHRQRSGKRDRPQARATDGVARPQPTRTWRAGHTR